MDPATLEQHQLLVGAPRTAMSLWVATLVVVNLMIKFQVSARALSPTALALGAPTYDIVSPCCLLKDL